jgi:hypothetical protein
MSFRQSKKRSISAEPRLVMETSDHDQHLVDRHDAVVHADDHAREIGVWEDRNGDAESEVAANQREADDQEEYGTRDSLKPKGAQFSA